MTQIQETRARAFLVRQPLTDVVVIVDTTILLPLVHENT